MDRISAPEQNRILSGIANLLRKIEQDSGPEFLPRNLDVMGLVRQLALPSAETVEKLSYGDPLFRMPTQSNIPITTDRGYLAEVLGMAPVVPAASRATTRISNEMADQLVKAITRNPEATAVRALEEIGRMSPVPQMFDPKQVKSVLPKTKIVDEEGNPKLMYHGTREDFEQFDPGSRGAVFASPDPKFTNVYAGEDMDRYLSGGNVRPVYVDAKNPFDYDNPDHVKAVVQYIKKNDPDFADIADSVGEKVGTGVYSQIERPLVQNAIRQLGFDGFFVQERGIKNIAVFDPNQIKSATSDPAFTGLLEPQAGAKTSSFEMPSFARLQPETSEDIDKIYDYLEERAKKAGYKIESGSSNVSGSRYLTIFEELPNDDLRSIELRVSNHGDRYPVSYADERLSIDPSVGGIDLEDALYQLQEKGFNLMKD